MILTYGLRRPEGQTEGRIEWAPWHVDAHGPWVMPASFAAAVQQLQRLTTLQLSCRISPAMVQVLPSTLQHLRCELRHATYAAKAQQSVVDMSHLGRMRELCLKNGLWYGSQLVLPTALVSLTILGYCDMRGLQNLTSLMVQDFGRGADLGQQLPVLASLRKLGVRLGISELSDMQSLATGLSSATQITALGIYTLGKHNHRQEFTRDMSGVRLHTCLCKLSQLCKLSICDIEVNPADIAQLTALTGLTSLTLWHCERLGNAAVARAVSQVTGLRKLALRHCSSDVVWISLGQLSRLQKLCLAGQHTTRLSGAGVHYLLQLTQLTRLVLERFVHLPPASDAKLMAAVPGLQRVEYG